MGTEAPYLSGVFRFVARLHTLSRRGMRMALTGQPKCRYGMLQSLYNLIEQHGCDGAIYVSDIARSRTATSSARQTPRTAVRRWCASPRQGSAPAKSMSRP